MSTGSIRTSVRGAIDYLTDHPDDARATDSLATATIEEGLRCIVRGPDGAEIRTDMVESVGGGNSAPSPGWLLRASAASCVATMIAMKAALEEIDLGRVEVAVDSESDDHGILGMDDSVPAGPLSVRLRVTVEAPEAESDRLTDLVQWAHDHCPVCDLIKREVPIALEMQIL